MKIGFIGAGNMGGAIIGAIIKAYPDVLVYDKNAGQTEELLKKYPVTIVSDSKVLAEESDIIVLSVKPNVLYSVIGEISGCVTADKIVVSIAAGQSTKKIEDAFSKKVKLIRIMPNTPALIGEGMSALCKNETASDDDLLMVKGIFDLTGKAEIVTETMMDIVTAVSGSSPAYIFMLIEAMADAAVLGGMPRKSAYTFAAQSVLGSAKMVLETGKHPAELKDMVCSPAGTTIEAVATLERMGFRSAVIEAIRDCCEKSKNL